MTATIMDGKKISRQIMQQCKARLLRTAVSGGIVTLGFSEEPSFLFGQRRKKAEQLMIPFDYIQVSVETIFEKIHSLNESPNILGIVLEMEKFPKSLSEQKVRLEMDYRKDVEGYHPINQGLLASGQPCFVPTTALAVTEMLAFYNISLEDKHVAVIGRGKVAGRPIADWLVANQATLTLIHSHTQQPEHLLKQADIIVSAVGEANLVLVKSVKKEAIVIDVGMSTDEEGQLVGDVAEGVHEVASLLSLVKGGIAPIGSSVFFKQLLEVRTK